MWSPTREQVARAQMTRFNVFVRARGITAVRDGDYQSLYDWSVRHIAEFWPAMWEYAGIVAQPRGDRLPWDRVVRGADRVAHPDTLKGTKWFV
jgi:acetoacetyl-CoA synthetase